MDNARDVIAQTLPDVCYDDAPFWEVGADRILGALTAAGYEIVQRDAPLPPTPGPFNPFGEQDGE